MAGVAPLATAGLFTCCVTLFAVCVGAVAPGVLFWSPVFQFVTGGSPAFWYIALMTFSRSATAPGLFFAAGMFEIGVMLAPGGAVPVDGGGGDGAVTGGGIADVGGGGSPGPVFPVGFPRFRFTPPPAAGGGVVGAAVFPVAIPMFGVPPPPGAAVMVVLPPFPTFVVVPFVMNAGAGGPAVMVVLPPFPTVVVVPGDAFGTAVPGLASAFFVSCPIPSPCLRDRE